jgi:hypothetical protein
MMARDLGVNAVQLSQALDVGQSTAYRWLAHNSAPKTALLAVFWLTTWGRSTLDAEAHNRANVYQGLAEAFERELWRQQQDFAKLANIGEYGSANDPLPHFAPLFESARLRAAERPTAAPIQRPTNQRQANHNQR